MFAVYLHARKRPEVDHYPPPPCYPPGYTLVSNIDAIWKCSSYQQRQDYRDHCQRLAHLTQHIHDHSAHSHERRNASLVRTNFPAMHPSTRRIESPRPPRTARPRSCGPTMRSKPVVQPVTPVVIPNNSSSSQYRNKLLAYIRQIQSEDVNLDHDYDRSHITTPHLAAGTSVPPADEPVQRTLPLGWDTAVDSKGRRYYIDHVRKQTTWDAPPEHIIKAPTVNENTK
ncbi:hypothetical protein, variant [Aphanomyces astaci]|uniref:WW domain-containing protein n=1 Tax=Aphanomyces astaci TaxID=112090 RepID=W4GZ88_APHAT|nr:hypothetical protein, variant [Aphanomyces astaci]ETV84238.1 hypothetical protein, variant [Aphanomyces astaci]|eukprot:XP_009825930.1 hypothetical protein, variant [Aphanomyces astaci]